MSEAIVKPNARQQAEEAYKKMMVAYDRFYHCPEDKREDFKLVYMTALNNYRDTCTVIVERLFQTNPKALEDLTILWMD